MIYVYRHLSITTNLKVKDFNIPQNLSPHLFAIISFPGTFANIFALTEDLWEIFRKVLNLSFYLTIR